MLRGKGGVARTGSGGRTGWERDGISSEAATTRLLGNTGAPRKRKTSSVPRWRSVGRTRYIAARYSVEEVSSKSFRTREDDGRLMHGAIEFELDPFIGVVERLWEEMGYSSKIGSSQKDDKAIKLSSGKECGRRRCISAKNAGVTYKLLDVLPGVGARARETAPVGMPQIADSSAASRSLACMI